MELFRCFVVVVAAAACATVKRNEKLLVEKQPELNSLRSLFVSILSSHSGRVFIHFVKE